MERLATLLFSACMMYPIAVIGSYTYTYTYQRPESPFAEPIPQNEKRVAVTTQVSPLAESEETSTRPNEQASEPEQATEPEYPNYKPQIVAYVSRGVRCLPCEQWISREMPDLVKAGWIVQVTPVDRGPWPRFRVLDKTTRRYLTKRELQKLIE